MDITPLQEYLQLVGDLVLPCNTFRMLVNIGNANEKDHIVYTIENTYINE